MSDTSRPESDFREMPGYTVAEAAHYLGLPVTTLRNWLRSGRGCKPLIQASQKSPVILLSFLNLTELHLLAAIRRRHRISLQKTRRAIRWLEKQSEEEHPLLSRDLETDGLNLFVDHYGKLINISQQGQLAIREILKEALQRIERDRNNVPVMLYPFNRTDISLDTRKIVINPRISGGRPVLTGTGLAVEIISERFKAGESIGELAYDYERKEEEIEEAIRWELPAVA